MNVLHKYRSKIDLYNIDNLPFMRECEDNQFDLAIVDIEYGIGASKPSKKPNKAKQKNGKVLNVKHTKYTPKDWDFKMSPPEYFRQLFRISERQIIFGGNYYGLSGGYLVWDKLNHETDQYGVELAWLSFSKRTDIVYYMWSGMMQGKEASKNVKKALVQQGNKTLNEKRIHPTQKPIKLYKWLLVNYAMKGDRIFDSHLGSGSIAVACDELGFDLTACEIDKELFDGASRRLQNSRKKQFLF